MIALQNLYSREKISVLPLCECGHIYSSFISKSNAKEGHQEQSEGKLFQQPCTPGHVGREREKDQTERWHLHIMVIDDTEIPERYLTCQGIAWTHSNF